jgi:hypothetical protein
METMDTVLEWWRAREATEVTGKFSSSAGYTGTVTVGEFPMQRLTLEFGDTITSFSCEACGKSTIYGNRVVIEAQLAPKTVATFTAIP